MNKKINKILITGGAGFIGSALIRYIMANTNYIVINVDKLTYSGDLSAVQTFVEIARYKFYKLDICDFKALSKIFEIEKPDFIMHLAAETHVDRSINSSLDFINTNIFGTFNLLEASRFYWNNLDEKKKQNFRFHHISTDEVYGDLEDVDGLFKENTPYSPSSPYSASKASSDHLVRAWRRTYGLPTLITNCSNNYGPYQYPEKLIPLTVVNALMGIEIPLYGDGTQIRDWLFVEDHVEALLTVLHKGQLGQTYNIGGNNELSNINVVNIICKYLNKAVPQNNNLLKQGFTDHRQLIKFVSDRPGHDKRYAIDTSFIEKKLGWKPKESFESGIVKTLDWYINDIDWLSAKAKEVLEV